MPTQLDGDTSGEATQLTVQVLPRSLLVRVKRDVHGSSATAVR
jgi:hypothetical protein